MSFNTTELGPRVSVTNPVLSDPASPVLDLSDAALVSAQTSASASSVVLADGELAVTEVSATSAVIAFRSGVTTYQFIADTGSVL